MVVVAAQASGFRQLTPTRNRVTVVAMDTIRRVGAWGDEGEPEVPMPLPLPALPPISPAREVASEPSVVSEFGRNIVPGPDNEIVSGQLSHALVLALHDEKPRVGGWGMLAKRLGIHSSLLQRLRAGTGNISSVDDVAGKLGWHIIIRRPR